MNVTMHGHMNAKYNISFICTNTSVFLPASASDKIQHLNRLMKMYVTEHGRALIDIRPSNVNYIGRIDERKMQQAGCAMTVTSTRISPADP
jgi:hypothetical protein